MRSMASPWVHRVWGAEIHHPECSREPTGYAQYLGYRQTGVIILNRLPRSTPSAGHHTVLGCLLQGAPDMVRMNRKRPLVWLGPLLLEKDDVRRGNRVNTSNA